MICSEVTAMLLKQIEILPNLYLLAVFWPFIEVLGQYDSLQKKCSNKSNESNAVSELAISAKMKAKKVTFYT